MNPTKSEGVLLAELHRIQRACRQGLISDEVLTGFVRIVREIELCADQQRLQSRSIYKSSNRESLAEHLELSSAVLIAPTHVKEYPIKRTFKNSAYSGPYTRANYSSANGFHLERENGRTGWTQLDVDDQASNYFACHFVITNSNGSYFGPILDRLKDVIYWHTLRFSYDDQDTRRLEFVCNPNIAVKRFE